MDCWQERGTALNVHLIHTKDQDNFLKGQSLLFGFLKYNLNKVYLWAIRTLFTSHLCRNGDIFFPLKLHGQAGIFKHIHFRAYSPTLEAK